MATFRFPWLAALLIGAAVALPAAADEHRGAAVHFDARYSHNQTYPARGYHVGARPATGVAVEHMGQRYWYGGGVWYGWRGGGWFVVGPPLGVFVPILPPFYTTVWFARAPYYYANYTYYVWRDADQGYEGVRPP